METSRLKALFRRAVAEGIARLPKGIMTDREFFELYESRGWHVTPVHFYHPVPDTRKLKDSLWERRSELVGVEVDIESQTRLLADFATLIAEFHDLPEMPSADPTQYAQSMGFNGLDAAILYSMVRRHRPRHIVEIGSGASTLLSLHALSKNQAETGGDVGRMTCIEPYPGGYLAPALDGRGELICADVQEVGLETFEQLGENDILFIDSSHVVQIGGDVNYEILEIVPRLKPGVLVHFHDIFLPFDYPKDWVRERHTFWTEQYLVHAFLQFNSAFRLLWSAGCMRAHRPDLLAQQFPYFDPAVQREGSAWIRRVA